MKVTKDKVRKIRKKHIRESIKNKEGTRKQNTRRNAQEEIVRRNSLSLSNARGLQVNRAHA